MAERSRAWLGCSLGFLRRLWKWIFPRLLCLPIRFWVGLVCAGHVPAPFGDVEKYNAAIIKKWK